MNDTEQVIEVPKGTDYRAEAHSGFWSNLKWRSLFCLLEREGNAPISQLAPKVGLTVEQAVRALEAMGVIGAIEKTATGYKQVSEFFRRNPTDKATRELILQNFVLSNNQVNNRILETADSERHFTKSVIYNSNEKAVAKLYSNIQKAIDEFKAESDNAPWDGVYALSTAVIPMTGEA